MGYSWIISGCLERLGLRGFWLRGEGSALRVLSQHKVLVGVETHPSRSHRCVTVNPFRDHLELKQCRVCKQHRRGRCGGSGFLHVAGEVDMQGRSKDRQPTRCWVTSEAAWCSCALNCTGLVLVFCEDVSPDSLPSKPCKNRQQSQRNVGLFSRLRGTAMLSR